MFPVEEKYNLNNQLNNQIRKAAVSCTANIAEGYGRFHYKDTIRFYMISRGSINELKDHLITCLDLKYIGESLLNEGLTSEDTARKTLNGYINFVKRRMRNEE